MESIIHQVIESEYRAQQIIAEAQEESKFAESRIQNEIYKLQQEVFSAALKKIEDIKAEKIKYARLQADDIASEAGVKALLMKERLQENRSRWARLLLSDILNNNE